MKKSAFTILFSLVLIGHAFAANRYWVGTTGTWDGTAGSKWSTTNGGTGGSAVPTSSDIVYFTSNAKANGTVTISGTRACYALNCSGWAGTMAAGTSTPILNIGSGTQGVVTLGGTWSYTGDLNLISTYSTGAGNAVTFGGKTVDHITFNGTGKWTLQDAALCTNAWTLTKGTLDTNGKAVSVGSFVSSNTNTRVLTLGASVIYITGSNISWGGKCWDITDGTNMTVNANTSTINLTGQSFTFYGYGFTYYDINLKQQAQWIVSSGSTFHTVTCGASSCGMTGATCTNFNFTSNYFGTGYWQDNSFSLSGNLTVSGTLTLSNETGADPCIIGSDTYGTARTITANGTISAQGVCFEDITGAGSASWNLSAITYGSGDCGGNSGITFTTGANVYWINAGGGWWNSTGNWGNVSGGGGPYRVPLPQDTAIFDANSITSSGKTITVYASLLSAIDFTNVANNPTLELGGNWNNLSTFGNVTLSANMTTHNDGSSSYDGNIQFAKRSATMTFNTAGTTFNSTIRILASGGTVSLGSNFTSGSTYLIDLRNGTLTTNNYNISCGSMFLYDTPTSATRVFNAGSSTINITGYTSQWWSGVIFDQGSVGTLTVNATSSTLSFTDTSSNDKKVYFSGFTWGNVTVTGGGTGIVEFHNDATLGILTLNAPKTVKFYAGNTYTLGNLVATGSVGNIITISSTSSGNQTTFSKPSGTVSCDYLSLQDSTATGGASWYAGANSTNVSGNNGWTFTAPPAGGSTFTLRSIASGIGEGISQ